MNSPGFASNLNILEALKNDDLEKINILLTQLGKTRFFNKTKPSPLDEASVLATG